ncbi:hypothetical protein P170DRAFT_98275 [Aspergillus steynii IBT 23096]|uniref:Uncharacterized protein n=1 Tax=Aspergillus steynii IBT 23096 TaxID=1392250 RepID=A0A2I2GH23_9EURO|nr:uncharacterized protein P170DRAFT_98275 [Aspergillus steynii IBT 23096]PLB52173.1 hypothetical protein P170DRAFT_98275 [Aspergillus steynii IBT 23096]
MLACSTHTWLSHRSLTSPKLDYACINLSLKMNSHVMLQIPSHTMLTYSVHALLFLGFNMLLQLGIGRPASTIKLWNEPSNKVHY